MNTMLTTLKQIVIKQLVKILPGLAKGFKSSLMGKKGGSVIYHRPAVPSDQRNNNVICMVHGFSGSANDTFGKFPELIKNDASLAGWDIISIGYASDFMPTFYFGLWAKQPHIAKIAGYIRTLLSTMLAGYGRIAFVGHSMGGLALQRAILDCNLTDRSRISHLLFYGTPSHGLRKASLARWYNIQIRDMAFNGSFVSQLRKDWNTAMSSPTFFFTVVAGELDDFVPEESSLQPFNAQYHARTVGNHIDMVKPDTHAHPSYQILLHALAPQPKLYLAIFNNLQLNALIGQYAQIVSTLKNQLAQLDSRTFKEYIFALEGYQNIDNAISTLEESQHIQNNTDFLGILAGRYKRRYLSNGTQADKNQAMSLYDSAYEKAVSANDAEQVYYHAINLAFLHLYGNNDKTLMKEYAQIALEKTQEVNQFSMWEDATRAEANLYLNNFDQALQFYQSAKQKAGTDNRALSSMYLNARNACSALDRNDWCMQIDSLFKN
jgi:pimeloyl-ACP methyl ester carboxylesterase